MKQRLFNCFSWTTYVILFFFLFNLLATPLSLLAQEPSTAVQGIQEGADQVGNAVGLTGNKTPEQVAGQIINTILGFLGVLFLLLTIYAGFLWMTASGDPKKSEKARDILKSAIIGLIVILAAYLLVNFVIFSLIIRSIES